MSKRKKRHAPRMPTPPPGPLRPTRPNWVFGPGVPTELDKIWDLQDAVENFVYWIKDDRFLAWEAIACQEQGLPLTALQEEAVGGIITFSDDDFEDDDDPEDDDPEDDDRVLYTTTSPGPASLGTRSSTSLFLTC